MAYRILTINPGSTSTKVAVFEDMEQVKTLKLSHSAEEISRFASVADQLEWRLQIILDAMKADGIELKSLDAVIGRGGLMRPIEGGVYRVGEAMIADLVAPKRQHASNLGALIARRIADEAGVEAYIADPVVVDELQDMARVSGLKELPRRSIFHALNQKAIARRYAKEIGRPYEELNLVVVHMGGGISVSAHLQGRVVDTNNALDGDGPLAPERAGCLPAGDLVDLCFSGKYDKAEIKKLLAGKGGLVDHVNCNNVQELNEVRAANGDQEARFMLDAMAYSVAKYIGEMAVVLKGKIDAILLTGGIAWNQCVNDVIIDYCQFLAPIKIYPGENELESLAENALRVLKGETVAKEY